jgi:hypothetical protein
MVRGSSVPEPLAPLQTIAMICSKLDQGVPEEKVKDWLTVEDNLFSFCVEFALENDLLVKQEDGRYRITTNGKEFVISIRHDNS